MSDNPKARPALVLCLMLAMLGWCLAGDVSGPTPAGKPGVQAPVMVAGRIQPSPQTSPGVVQNVAVTSEGRVQVNLPAASPLPISLPASSPVVVVGPLPAGSPVGTLASLPATVQGFAAHNAVYAGNPVAIGGYSVTAGILPGVGNGNGFMVKALYDLYGRTRNLLEFADGTVVNGTALGLYTQGPAAQGATASGNPVRIGGRARDQNSPYSAVSADDVADFVTTLFGELRSTCDASKYATGLDSKSVPQEAGGSTAVSIKSSSGNLYSISAYSPTSAVSYLQVYNIAQGSVTVGTSSPTMSICIGNSSFAPATGLSFNPPIQFSNGGGFSYAVTTTANGSTAPAANVTLHFGYK